MGQCADGQDCSQNSLFSQGSRLNFESGDDISTPVYALDTNCGRNPRSHRLSKSLGPHRVQVLMHIMFDATETFNASNAFKCNTLVGVTYVAVDTSIS
jgi:ribosomal protein L32